MHSNIEHIELYWVGGRQPKLLLLIVLYVIIYQGQKLKQCFVLVWNTILHHIV
jgi:hypothetical protein